MADNTTKYVKVDIEVQYPPYLHVTTIPKGALAIPGPDGKYWAVKWDGMTEEEKSWARTYGYLLEANEVE